MIIANFAIDSADVSSVIDFAITTHKLSLFD